MRGTKALFLKLQESIDKCITRTEYEKTNSDVPRILAEVGIFKEKMRIYEKMFVGKQDTENVENKVNVI